MRTISSLLKHDGTIYVFLPGKALPSLFLRQAEEEGFTFGDGVKPTERDPADLFSLHRDFTISYVGWAGHMAWRSTKTVAGKRLIRVDYGKYLAGCRRYTIRRQRIK